MPNGRLTAPAKAPPRIRNTTPEEDDGSERHDEDDRSRPGLGQDRDQNQGGRVETDADHGSPYEAHIRRSDGMELEVLVNKDFSVTAVNEMGPPH